MNQLITKCKKHNFRLIEAKKVEGILRNFLFTNSIAGQFVRVINKFQLGPIISIIDEATKSLLGESQIILVLRKKSSSRQG